MTSYHVICHVTAVLYASLSSIKSRKIDKRKILVLIYIITHNKPSFKETLMFSTVSLVTYHNKMTINNNNNGDIIIEPINIS